MVNWAIERQEKLKIETIRKQGEYRDWYQFIKRDNSKSLKFSESIKSEVKIITGSENIRKEIEKFWSEIGKGNSTNFRYTCDIYLTNRRRYRYFP